MSANDLVITEIPGLAAPAPPRTIDLEKTEFAFRGRTAPGRKLAELLGIAEAAATPPVSSAPPAA